MPGPSDLPVPIVFIGRKAAEVTGAPYFPAVPNTTSVSLLHNFLALDDNNTRIPPDTAGAVGPNHLVVAHNSQIRVETRGGGVLSTGSLTSFFNAIRNGQAVFDPRIAYDTRTDRWIICAVADDKTSTSDSTSHTSSGLLLGISNSADPLGAWTLYRFVGDPTNLTWLDYPQLGFDDSNIVISTNVYSISDDKFKSGSVFVISKSTMKTSTFDIPTSGFTLMPTVSLDPGSTSYLIQRWNGNSSGVGWMRLYSVSSAGVSPIAYVQGPQPWSQSGADFADFAPQLGTSRLIDAGDDRVLSAVYRNGSIWATHTVFLPADSPKRASVQWWQISPSGLILQRGLIDDPAGATFYAYPSIAVNVRNEVLIGGSQFSSSTYASCFAAVRSSGDPPDTISSPLVYKSGLAPYYKLFTEKRNRWGDYSTSIVDPTNDTEFWTIQEYAASPSGGNDRWGTWWAHVAVGVSPPPPPTITFTANPTFITTGQASTLSWTVTNATAVSIDQSVGAQPLSGSVLVSPTVTTAFTLTATGAGGTSTKQLTITVATPPPAPTITFAASPTSITLGQTSTLSWAVTNATNVTIDHGIGAQPITKSVSVSPATTTTYTLTATGVGGTATARATVTVIKPSRRRPANH